MTWSINNTHKMFKKHCLSKVLKIFYQKRFLNPYFQNAYYIKMTVRNNREL